MNEHSACRLDVARGAGPTFGQRIAAAAVLGLLLSAFLGAFGVAWITRPALPDHAAETATRDFSLTAVAATTAAHYRHAAAHADVYREVACYCGCDSFADHRSLLDCFLRPNGSAWDAHAAGCGICQEEATEVRRLQETGHPASDIPDAVDSRFRPPPAATT